MKTVLYRVSLMLVVFILMFTNVAVTSLYDTLEILIYFNFCNLSCCFVFMDDGAFFVSSQGKYPVRAYIVLRYLLCNFAIAFADLPLEILT